MKKIFYQKFFNGIILDFFALLAADINSETSVKKIALDEVYTNEGSLIEIVGMRRRFNLFQWLLPTRIFEALIFKQKNRYNNRVFTVYN